MLPSKLLVVLPTRFNDCPSTIAVVLRQIMPLVIIHFDTLSTGLGTFDGLIGYQTLSDTGNAGQFQ
jgi:hypothetical protein